MSLKLFLGDDPQTFVLVSKSSLFLRSQDFTDTNSGYVNSPKMLNQSVFPLELRSWQNCHAFVT